MNTFPIDILREIGSYLDYEEVERTYRCLSKRFYTDVCNDYFWLKRVRRDVPLWQCKQLCAQDYITLLYKAADQVIHDGLKIQDKILNLEHELLVNKGIKDSKVNRMNKKIRILTVKRDEADTIYQRRRKQLVMKARALRGTIPAIIQPAHVNKYVCLQVDSKDRHQLGRCDDRISELIKIHHVNKEDLLYPGCLIAVLSVETSALVMVLYTYFDKIRLSVNASCVSCFSGTAFVPALQERMDELKWTNEDLQRNYNLPYIIRIV